MSEGLIDRVNNMESSLEEIKEALNKKKPKKFRLFTKGLIGRRKIRTGYVLVISIGENGAISFMKEPIVDYTIKLGDTFHVVGKENIFIYKNKPAVIIFKGKIHAFSSENEKNETMGQKYILARMQNEAIKPKKGIGAMGGWILLLLIAGGVAYYFFGGGGG